MRPAGSLLQVCQYKRNDEKILFMLSGGIFHPPEFPKLGHSKQRQRGVLALLGRGQLALLELFPHGKKLFFSGALSSGYTSKVHSQQ